jgi:translocation protein SEC62
MEYIRKSVLKITNNLNDLGNDEKYFMQNFYEVYCNKYRLIFKVVKHADETNPKLKFPKLLDQDKEINKFHIFEKEKFYFINFDRPVKKKNLVLLFFIVISIVSLCLFPLWPLSMKFGVWYILVGLMIALVSYYDLY